MFPNAWHTRGKFIAAIFALLSLVSAASCQPTTSKSPQTEGEKYQGLKETTVRAATNLTSYRANDVYGEVETLLKQFNDLYKKVKETLDTDKIIMDIEKGVKSMAGSYRKLASMEIDITQVFNKEFATLTTTAGTTVSYADTANAEIAQHQKTIADLEQSLKLESNPIEKRKKEITIGGYKSKINFLYGRKAIWDKFSTYQDQLLKTLGTNRENIGLLFHALKVNAEVYEEAAKTIELRRRAYDALGNLKGLANIESLLADILNTQIALDDLVQQIATLEFNPDLKQEKQEM